MGDGSGSNWQQGCGWGVSCIEKLENGTWRWPPKVLYGGMYPATVNISELMPYIQALSWYIEHLRRRRKEEDLEPKVRIVQIITDSQVTEKRGGDSSKSLAKKNRGFWNVFSMLERQGLEVRWNHTLRDTITLNIFADKISKMARLALKESDIDDEISAMF